MHVTIEVLLPVFAIIMCGYGASRWKLIERPGINGLMDFVQYFAVPALLFRVLVSVDLASESLRIVASYFGGCVLMFVLALSVGRLAFRLPLEQRAIMGMGAMYSNTVLLALPLVLTIFGEEGLAAILPIVTLQNITLFPLVIVAIELSRGRSGSGQSLGAILWSSLRGTLANPIIGAIVAGFIWSGLGWGLPGPLDTFTETMARAVAPAALFALGASMAAFGLGGRISESITIVGLKLIVHPLLVWCLGRFVFELEPLTLMVVTLTAAMPVGAHVFVMAHRYQVYLARTASALVISGMVSVITLTVLLTIFAV